MQENSLVGVIEDWRGPLPGKGDYIYHPPFEGDTESNVMSVKTVTYRMLTRSGAGYFTAHRDPYVEICV